MKILITGGRKITNVEWIFSVLKKELTKEDIVIHGGANGVDSIVQAFCSEHNIYQVIMRPIYPSKKEYYLHRNAEMIGMCDRVIAFPNEESKGTWFTITYAKKRKLQVNVYKEKK